VYALQGIRHSPRYSEKIYFDGKTQEGKRLGRTIEDARRETPARIQEAFESVRPERWRIGTSGIGQQYGTFGPFRRPGAKATRWCALLTWERHA
jgi:hypothetical protein